MTRSLARPLGFVAVAALFMAACGGDDSSSIATTAPAPAESTAPTDEPDESTAPGENPGEDPAPSPDFTPGDVAFRVVNLLDQPVDVHVRTTGLITAYLMEADVATGAVTERYAPPPGGSLIVTTAGAGDAECVVGCDHFLAEAGTFADNGPLRTLVLYDDGGMVRNFDVWEDPVSDSTGNANAMPRADADTGLFVTLAVGLTNADFGQQLSFDGVDGCQENFNLAGVIVGGNQTPAFVYDGSTVDVFLHDNQDRECVDEPTGGPFTIMGGPGARTLLILTGTPGDMDAIVLPIGADEMSDPLPTTGGGNAPDDAVEILSADLMDATGLPAADALCVAGDLIEELGADFFFDDNGELLDAEELSDEDYARFEAALGPIAEGCGIEF